MDRNLRGAKTRIQQRRGLDAVERNGHPPKYIVTIDNDKLLVDRSFFRNVANILSNKMIKRPLQTTELQSLKNFIMGVPPERFVMKTADYAYNQIANEFYNQKFKSTQNLVLDTKEYAKDIITLGGDNPVNLSSVAPSGQSVLRDRLRNESIQSEITSGSAGATGLPLSAGLIQQPSDTEKLILITEDILESFQKYVDYHNNPFIPYYTEKGWSQIPQRQIPLSFDSRFRDIEFNEVGRIRFRPTTAASIGTTNGQIRLPSPLENISRMQIETKVPFFIPRSGIDFSIFEKVRLNIDEMSGTGSVSPENYTFHWEFKTDVQGQKVFLTPTREDIFPRNNITLLDTITFSFRDPSNLIAFDDDRLQFVITAGSNPALFTTSTGQPHGQSTGDLIYIDDPINPANNYTNVPSNPTIDAIMNATSGHKITVINATQFTIPVDLSGLAVNQLQNVYFGSKRIIFRINFTCDQPAENV